MGFPFRKSVKILPGVRLNFSTSGVSASIGPRGASVTIGKRGVYGSGGIPGRVLRWRERLDDGSTTRAEARPRGPRPPGIFFPFVGFYFLFYAVGSILTPNSISDLIILASLTGAGVTTWYRRRSFFAAKRNELA